ncbi:thioesterase domain-containing protein, partial [Rhodococcus sp. NPDC059234]|uniref:thioesterase domain-containing protein n=1 Tax=Rhodococcus sp. NPDC059234 TaxID=3346781 RepID=UPI00366B998E
RVVASVFGELLGVERVGLDDDFFGLGGNSLIAMQAASRLGAELAVSVPVMWLFTTSTTEALAARIVSARLGLESMAEDAAFDVLLPLRPGGSKPPVFCIHPIIGLSWAFAGLSAHIDRERGIYGLQSPVLSGVAPMPETVEAWARMYVEQVRTVQPEGPYNLIGWSLGGVIAHAMAALLQSEGDEVSLLAMMDSFAERPADGVLADRAMTAGDLLGGLLPALVSDAPEASLEALADEVLSEEMLGGLVENLPAPFNALGAERIAAAVDAAGASVAVMDAYLPAKFKGDLVYFAALADDPTGSVGAGTWQDGVDGRIRAHGVDETHWGMASPAALAKIGAVLREVWDSEEVAADE